MILTNEGIYNYVRTVLRKDTRGGSFTVDEFNRIYPILVQERFITRKKEMERTSDITEPLERYSRSVVFSGSPSYLIPEGWAKHLGAVSSATGVDREVDYVTKMEFTKSSALTRPTKRDAVMYYEDGKVHVKPEKQNITLHYLVSPNVPFLDYYYNANRNLVFLGEGAAQSIESPAEYRDGTTGLKTSITKECDMSVEDKIAIVYMMLKQRGVSIPDDILLQYGMNEQLKTEK